jgi:hypothetical protein
VLFLSQGKPLTFPIVVAGSRHLTVARIALLRYKANMGPLSRVSFERQLIREAGSPSPIKPKSHR